VESYVRNTINLSCAKILLTSVIEVDLHKRINKSTGKFSAFTFEGVCVNRDAAPLFLDFNIRWSDSHTCHFIFREK